MRAGLLTNRARILRPGEPRSNTGGVEPGLVEIGEVSVHLREPRTRTTDFGAGEEAIGAMEAEMHYSAADRLQHRDVLDIISGPEKGSRWRLTSRPHRIFRKRTIASLEPYHGEVPA